MILRAILAFFISFALASAAAPPLPGQGEPLDLSSPQAVIVLGPALSGQAVKNDGDPEGAWFTVEVKNPKAMPASRVLSAADSASAGLLLFPVRRRPALTGAVTSDPDVVADRASAFGEGAYRIVLPPSRSATLALHYAGAAADPPAILAWNEAALIAHNREAAVLNGLVCGLLLAATGFAAGAALLSGRIFCRWAAGLLLAVFLAELTEMGVFDDTPLTALSGPYGLFAFFLALAMAAGLRLVDYIASLEAFLRGASVWRDRVAVLIAALGAAALVGIPMAGLLIRALAVAFAAGAAGYLAHCGRLGIAGARRLAPAATIFALVTAAATFHALGLFGVNLVAPGAIGGFAAAGGLLVALATALPLEPAKERLRQFRKTRRHDDVQATLTDEALDREREHAALGASHQGVFDLDLQTGVLSLSAGAAGLMGLAPTAVDLDRAAWLGRLFPDDRALCEQALETYREQPGTAFRMEFRAHGSSGRLAWFELRATVIGGPGSLRCLGLIADVTLRKSLEASAPLAEAGDALTGAATRAQLVARLDSLGARFRTAALAVFDLDRFKAVNESLGRDGADLALKAFAERFQSSFAPYDGRVTFYRLGGDMFAALALDIASAEGFGRGIVELAAAPFAVLGRDIYLPISAGIATGNEAADATDLIQRAEQAMVDAKCEGGGRLRLFSKQRRMSPARDSLALESDLRRAMEKGEIELHYQPIVELKGRTLVGFEALLRWRHPRQGMIEPEAFIPQAERSGLILPLGRFALARAATDLRDWQRDFPSQPALFVSVNVTWRQIADESFASELAALLKEAQLHDRSLKLEITESAVMAGAADAEAALRRLKALDVGLAIDDFGTGHSSLAHLRRFPFEVIKIDKSFLADAQEGPGAAILSSIIALASELKLAVVAEGVESESDVRLLSEMGCDLGQGYFFGTPMPAQEVVLLMTSLRDSRSPLSKVAGSKMP